MSSSSDEDETYVFRQPGCRKRGRTVPNLNINTMPSGVQLQHATTAVHEISGVGAHGIGPGRSLRIGKARGQLALHTDRPRTITDVQQVGAGSIADRLPVWNHHGKRRRSARSPQEEVFLSISFNSAHGEGAHEIDHRRRLRLVEDQGRMAWRTNRPVDRQTSWRWVRSRLPKRHARGVQADASPMPQARIQHCQATHPVACVSSSRRKRYSLQPTAYSLQPAAYSLQR